MSWRVSVAAITLLLLATTATWAQNSEYASPQFDPDHAGDSFLPVETVDTFSGGLLLSYTDISLPGPGGFDLNIVRWYSSKINAWNANCVTLEREESSVGAGWQMHMGRLWDNPDSIDPVPAYRLELPGGQHESFYNDDRLNIPNADYVSPNGWSLRDGSCVAAPGVCRIATSPAGIEYQFPTSFDYRMDPDDSYLYVRTIRDPIDNRITVTYDFGCNCNQAYIDTITDAFGREVEFHYTGASSTQGTCSLGGEPCFSNLDCQDYCAGAGSTACNSELDCSPGSCSDSGEPCDAASDCPRHCSDDPGQTCTADIECGQSHCVGGADNGQPCDFDFDCDNVCQGGGNPGAACNSGPWQCTSICQGGSNPGASCTSSAQCGGLCQGGSDAGQSCSSSSQCDGICQGGGNPGTPCNSSTTCTNICQGGSNPGTSCTSSSQCFGICQGGSDAGQNCSSSSQCGGICTGGGDQGDPCSSDFQCRNVCSNNPIASCSIDFQCPGGFCNIGTCSDGICSQGTCVSGSCSPGSCALGTCLEGTCNEGTCPPGPVCNPQPTCNLPECLDSVCEGGSEEPGVLDKITVAWLGGTATYEYTVDETSQIDPVLVSFTTPTGQTTTYDHAPEPGEANHDLELKQITLPTGTSIDYTYADHQFFYPLRNTGQNIECTRVVTEKQIGPDTWTYDFPSGQPTDRTTVVTDPVGDVREYVYTRYSDTGQDRIWKAGLLESMTVKDGATVLLEEEYEYEPFQISFDNVSPLTGYTEFAQVARMVEQRVTHRSQKTTRTVWGDYDDYNNPGFVEEYDFSDALYRTTEYEYEHSDSDGDDGTFLNAHIVDRTTAVRIRTAGGVKVAETLSSYGTGSSGWQAFGHLDYEEKWTGSAYVRTDYEYDAFGQPTELRNSGGGLTRTNELLYSSGMLDRVRVGGKTLVDRVIHAASGLITSETNEHGATTSFGYDLWGRLTSIDPTLDPTTSIVYGTQTITVSKGGSEVLYTYDGLGRLLHSRTKIDSGAYAYQRVDYDAVGNVQNRFEAADSLGSGAKTTFTYDALGRTILADRPDGTTSFSFGADTVAIADGVASRTITYDAFGRIHDVRVQRRSLRHGEHAAVQPLRPRSSARGRRLHRVQHPDELRRRLHCRRERDRKRPVGRNRLRRRDRRAALQLHGHGGNRG